MRISRFVFAIGVAALLGSVALTQPPEGKGEGKGKGGMRGPGMMMGRGGGLGLLAVANVQEELKLSDDQKEKVKELIKTAGEKMRDVQDKEPEDRMAAMKDLADSNNKALKEILKPEQQKRFNEIKWQQGGV